jgi:hypothetical protein
MESQRNFTIQERILNPKVLDTKFHFVQTEANGRYKTYFYPPATYISHRMFQNMFTNISASKLQDGEKMLKVLKKRN